MFSLRLFLKKDSGPEDPEGAEREPEGSSVAEYLEGAVNSTSGCVEGVTAGLIKNGYVKIREVLEDGSLDFRTKINRLKQINKEYGNYTGYQEAELARGELARLMREANSDNYQETRNAILALGEIQFSYGDPIYIGNDLRLLDSYFKK